jgi:hypothetical protein
MTKKMTDAFEVLRTQKKVLESQGYKVCYIAVYGSQNYNLDIYTEEYKSDIDMKAIIIPTLDDLITNSKPISIAVDTEWGQCDVKDIRIFFETLLKSNPAYVETLFTDYYIIDFDFVDKFAEIFSLRDDLIYTLRAQYIRAIYGMMLEKQKAMKHPYPSIIHKIEKFGYDGKQIHHINRLWFMMQDYFVNSKPLKKCFTPNENEIQFLLDLKINKYPMDFAEGLAEGIIHNAKQLKDEVLQQIDEKTMDYSIKDKFISLSNKIIKDKIVMDIINKNN